MYQRVPIPFSRISPPPPPVPVFSLERKEYVELILDLQENRLAIFTPYFHINLQAFLSDRTNQCLLHEDLDLPEISRPHLGRTVLSFSTTHMNQR